MMPGVPFPQQPPEGNAIYRIDREGFVTEVFRQPAMVLSLIERDGILIAGTGSEGLIYQVDPAAEETLVLAKVEPKQVTSLLPTRDGAIILGLSNAGGLASMSRGFAPKGTYTSPVLDALQVSRFGKVHLRGSLPQGSTLTLATRSGNLQEPGQTGWSNWSAENPAAEFLPVPSPSARFLQYRLTMTSQDGKSSPVVDELSVAHQVPNLSPRITNVQIAPAPDPENQSMPPSAMNLSNPAAATPPPVAGRMRIVAWEVADPNNDPLEFSLHFRPGSRGPWIVLAEKLKEPTYQWDTRGVADGRYHLRVTASDVKSNPLGEGREGQRISDPVIVDNTAPVIGDLKTTPGGVKTRIEANIVDRASTITRVEYAINSKDDWQTIAASDTIYDSPQEGVSFSLEGLKPGLHQVMLRATDGHGNQSHETVTVNIEAAK
jgi:hypothetical protein